MNSSRLWALALFCGLLLLGAPVGPDAAINPKHFKKGPEQIVVKVVGRSVRTYAKVVSVQLLAEVRGVERSATALQPGDTILISYDRHPEALKKRVAEQRKNPMPGPQILHQPFAPKLNDVVKAYLRHLGDKQGRVYRPTAHQYSFERR